MLSKNLESVLNGAFVKANSDRFKYMGLEQLTLSLLNDETVIAALSDQDVSIDLLKHELELFIREHSEIQGEDEALTETQPTQGFQKALQRAVFHVQTNNRTDVTSTIVLNTILSGEQSDSVRILKKYKVSTIDTEESKPVFGSIPEARGKSGINVQVKKKPTLSTIGPLDTDIKTRELINYIWGVLPEHSRSITSLEEEVLRLLKRAIKDLDEDLSLAKKPNRKDD